MATPSPEAEHTDKEVDSSRPTTKHEHDHDLPHEASDYEKTRLAAYEGHDADIPSNVGYILDERGEEKRRQSIAASHRHASNAGKDVNGKHKELEAGKISAEDSGDDSNIVFWDGPNDPQNPLNFGKWIKVLNIVVVSCICFVTPLGSSMFAPGVPELMEEFKSSNVLLASFVVSVYVLGFAIGPLFFAPMSEIYGRMPIYHVCNLGYLAFTIGCALATDLNMLIGFRLMAGIFGSAPLANGGGTIADLAHPEQRAVAMLGFVLGPIVGPVIGPIAGGFLSQAKGWRWVFWVLSMISGSFSLLGLLCIRETYGPVILARKTARLQRETGNMELRSKFDVGLSPKDFFLHSIVRAAKMLIFSPIVLILSIFVGVVYGYLYLLFTTFTFVFEKQYHFSSGIVGLSFLGLGLGSVAGLGFFFWSAANVAKKQKAAVAQAEETGQIVVTLEPELRLHMLTPIFALIPIGFLVYGWTSYYKVHWIVPILATLLIGVGNIAVFMAISLYLMDAFTLYAASALAANTVIRSVAGAVLPLAGQKMYNALGLGWGNSLLAFLAIALLPVPWSLVRWGPYLRKKFKIKNL